MPNISDQALFGGHFEDFERLTMLRWKLQGPELTAVDNVIEAKLIFLLSCSPEVSESKTMEYVDRAIALRRKMTHLIDGYDSGAGSTSIDPVIVQLIKRLYILDNSDVDLLTSVERLSNIRTQIPGNAELATEFKKVIEHKLRDLAVTASVPFSVAMGEDRGNLDDSAILATEEAPKGYVTLKEHHDIVDNLERSIADLSNKLTESKEPSAKDDLNNYQSRFEQEMWDPHKVMPQASALPLGCFRTSSADNDSSTESCSTGNTTPPSIERYIPNIQPADIRPHPLKPSLRNTNAVPDPQARLGPFDGLPAVVQLPDNCIRVPCEANADPFQKLGVLYSSNQNHLPASGWTGKFFDSDNSGSHC